MKDWKKKGVIKKGKQKGKNGLGREASGIRYFFKMGTKENKGKRGDCDKGREKGERGFNLCQKREGVWWGGGGGGGGSELKKERERRKEEEQSSIGDKEVK